MNLKKIVFLAGFSTVLFIAQAAFAQDADTGSVLITNQQAATQEEGQMQWAWGEVTQIDQQARNLTLKYLDYESDQEKDLVLTVDDKTAFENFKDLGDLKVKDTLSIDYVIAPGAVNLAKNISLEKPDEVVIDTTVPMETVTPAVVVTATPVVSEAVSVPASMPMNEEFASTVTAAQEMVPMPVSMQEPAVTLMPAQEPTPVPADAQEPAPAQ